MRVLTIVSEAPPIQSGVARCVGAVTEGLRARGHHVDIVSCVDVPRWSFGEFRFTGFAGRLPELARALESYDIVNVHGPAPTLSDLMLMFLRSRSTNRPAVVYTHHSDIDVQGWGLASDAYNRFHRSIAAVADQIVVTSEAYRRNMQPSGAP